MRRRHWLATLALASARGRIAPALAAAAALPGCGFALRRPPALPFSSIALVGFAPHSPLADELKSTLAPSVRVVGANERPEVLLQAVADRREKVVVAATAAGQVREVQLRVRFEFKLTAPSGRELLPPAPLLLARDLSYSESFALAKEQEENQLYAAMQSEIVMLVLRRLAQASKA